MPLFEIVGDRIRLSISCCGHGGRVFGTDFVGEFQMQ